MDITVPVYHFAETHYLDNLLVTPAYKLTLFALTGRVNDSAFKGFAAGDWLSSEPDAHGQLSSKTKGS